MLRKIFTALFILSTVILYAQDSVESDFRARLEQFSSKNSTITANFTQSKKIPNFNSLVKSSGKFYYTNSGSLALIYDKPAGDKIVMSNNSFTIISSGNVITSKASGNPVLSQIATMMQGCMSGNLSEFNSGWSFNIKRDNNLYYATLTPINRRIKKYISQITMVFSYIDMTLNELKMEEATGGYTSYKFLDKRLNVEIDSKHFND